MVSPITWLWSMLSLVVATICTSSLFQPFWFLNLDFTHSFGMLAYCHLDQTTNSDYLQQIPQCASPGLHVSSTVPRTLTIPVTSASPESPSSPTVSKSFAHPGTSVTPVALVAHTIHSMPVCHNYGGVMLLVCLLVAGLLLYPIVLSSAFSEFHCGRPSGGSYFWSGDCHMGWSYMLAITGTSLSVFCPFLSRYTDMKVDEVNPFQQITHV
ncbi:LHFPL tetraspan subfamily member 7 protein-like [Octopus bimaculoides]|uniref:LHFPL tetraspan subfamily member 7 protein-like n=1 Tax=Octopus bimaculoides TaxID=37653 RepID=UPI00071E1559|nr:LHFPL tetraspan subfamily member 7 protein-like [Octopus bimaculoides]|eukprot:XP_014773524.1 PREDICTED: transmembrane protein 211-like [Octopus bimaculoides]